MEITNEERREVAERLRDEAQLWHMILPGVYLDRREESSFFSDIMHFVGINGRSEPEAICNRLADLIDRPICKPKDRGIGYVDAVCDSFCCPSCGFEIDVHIGEDQHLTEAAKYCPNCGAEVIE